MLCIARTLLSQDVCPSVCPSHASIVSKRRKVSSGFFTFILVFSNQTFLAIFQVIPLQGVECRGVKNRDFRWIYRFVSEMIQHMTNLETSYFTQLNMLPNDNVSMEHVIWKSPGPMCGWVGRILHPDSCTSVSSWSKVPFLSIWSVAVPLCRPLLPCPSQW